MVEGEPHGEQQAALQYPGRHLTRRANGPEEDGVVFFEGA